MTEGRFFKFLHRSSQKHIMSVINGQNETMERGVHVERKIGVIVMKKMLKNKFVEFTNPNPHFSRNTTRNGDMFHLALVDQR